jgi:phenylpropionate dioxygenase-like ring-hydroxylating dioxygenase large terminal subunit
MFTNTHSLQHLLRPEHYCSDHQHALELDRLFRNAWQFVAAKSELAKDGDFLTLDLFGRPIIVRNSRGKFLAYENICSHRHCLLTDAARGNQPVLRCQYHGWEYDDQGRTGKIPEAKCFRPWDRDNSRLNMFRLESCGDLLFVCLHKDGPSLKEWLHPFFDETEQAFSAPEWKMAYVWEYECECNWKVPAENTLESYHVTALHQKFFGDVLPPEERATHILNDRYTALTYAGVSKMEMLQAKFRRWLGGTPIESYLHRHIFPNTILVSTDTINYALMYVPLSPRRVQIRMRLFAIRGTHRDPLSRFVSWLAWRVALSKTLQVHNEDRNVYASQQKGLECSTHPGVIGIREERIYAFQKYILEGLGLPIPTDPMTDSEVSSAETSCNLP